MLNCVSQQVTILLRFPLKSIDGFVVRGKKMQSEFSKCTRLYNGFTIHQVKEVCGVGGVAV